MAGHDDEGRGDRHAGGRIAGAHRNIADELLGSEMDYARRFLGCASLASNLVRATCDLDRAAGDCIDGNRIEAHSTGGAERYSH